MKSKFIQFVMLLCLSSMAYAVQTSQTQNVPTDAQVFNNEKNKVSYALGVEIGESFKLQAIDIKPELLLRGIKDGVKGGKYAISQQQLDEALINFRKQQISKQEAQIRKIAKANAKQSQEYLNKNKSKKGFITTKSGLQYRVLKQGKGAKPKATDYVTVDYRGTFTSGEEFDSSYKRGQPAKFKLSQVIPGWTEALQLMNEGSTWELVIPPKLAYGENGMGGIIGPNETLVFKVHLISIKKG